MAEAVLEGDFLAVAFCERELAVGVAACVAGFAGEAFAVSFVVEGVFVWALGISLEVLLEWSVRGEGKRTYLVCDHVLRVALVVSLFEVLLDGEWACYGD